ncbi:MAG: hypothetical protein ACOX2F_09630 [bacterium]
MKQISLKTGLLVAAIFIVFLLFLNEQNKNRELSSQVVELEKEKISLLSEYEECLRFKEVSLKKELVGKYIDSIVNLVDKVENGDSLSEKELLSFEERVDFILDNMEFADFSREESFQTLLFINSAKKLFEPFITAKKSKIE